ncbi:MAG: hypothetical protein ACW97P_06695 [Candidatus Hodarchaeales archaeon]|jgi:hypothetical protein
MVTKTESPIVGVIISIFTDAGPQVIFNSAESHLSENQAFNLSIRIMTLIGEEISGDLFGPLPVPSNEEYLTLAYAFFVNSTFTTDPRLSKRPCVICVIFKRQLKRIISHAHGLILSYLSNITSDVFKTEEDLQNDKMAEIDNRLTALISTNPIRIYRVSNDKLIEHLDSLMIPSDAYIVADLEKKILFVMYDQHLSPVRKRNVSILIDKLNEKEYRRGFNKRIVDSEDEAEQLLNFFGLKKNI